MDIQDCGTIHVWGEIIETRNHKAGKETSEGRYDKDYEIIKGNIEWVFAIHNTRSKISL